MPLTTDQNEKNLLHKVDTTIKIKKRNKTFIDAIRILPDESNLKLKILRANYYTLGKSLDYYFIQNQEQYFMICNQPTQEFNTRKIN